MEKHFAGADDLSVACAYFTFRAGLETHVGPEDLTGDYREAVVFHRNETPCMSGSEGAGPAITARTTGCTRRAAITLNPRRLRACPLLATKESFHRCADKEARFPSPCFQGLEQCRPCSSLSDSFIFSLNKTGDNLHYTLSKNGKNVHAI